MVFAVKIMVEDKKLHKLLWSLDGIVLGTPEVIPVRTQPEPTSSWDAETTAEVVKLKPKKAKTVRRRVAYLTVSLNNVLQACDVFTHTELSKADIRTAMESVGLSGTSVPYVLQSLKDLGYLNRVGYNRYVRVYPNSEKGESSNG